MAAISMAGTYNSAMARTSSFDARTIAVLRWIAISTLCSVGSACYSWNAEPGPVPAAAVSATNKDKDIRVRLTNGAELYFSSASVTGDSLVGMSRGRPTRFGIFCGIRCMAEAAARPSRRQSVPLSQVGSLAVYEFSPGDLLLGVLVLAAVVVGGFFLITSSLQ
jgi:hypothetical protein